MQGGGWAEASTDGTRRGEQDRKYRKMLAKKHKRKEKRINTIRRNVKMKEKNIRTSYPICWAVMQAAKEVERCWFSAQGDAVGENIKRDAKIFLQIRCHRGEVKL